MKPTSKKVARPTISSPPLQDPDPLGFFPAISARLQEAYRKWLHTLLRDYLLVKVEPHVRRRLLDAGTAEGLPVSFSLTITVHPRDSSGFARVVGALETPFPDQHSPDDPDGTYVTSLFTGKAVWMPRPKRGWRRFGRRR
jgi:hypothetical protein